MEKDRSILPIVIIVIVILVGAIFGSYILFGTDVFANEITAEEAQVIINNVVNEGITDPAEKATVGTPEKVTLNGVTSWRVPVTYTGKNKERLRKLNGSVTLPTKPPKEGNNNVISIILADGTTIEVVTTPDGTLVTINTPNVLPTAEELEKEKQEQEEQEQQEEVKKTTTTQQTTQTKPKTTTKPKPKPQPTEPAYPGYGCGNPDCKICYPDGYG
ncbi:MAG: hypothetical protein QME14_05730 [Methanobacteriaceae archaeon]|nr:hypothetical protein [Methanobacteriaceae archaeon]